MSVLLCTVSAAAAHNLLGLESWEFFVSRYRVKFSDDIVISQSVRWLRPILFIVPVGQDTNRISLYFPPLARWLLSKRLITADLLNVKLYGPTLCTHV